MTKVVFLLGAALSLASAADSTLERRNGICDWVPYLAQGCGASSSAISFCSSFLGIQPSTVTTTLTSTVAATFTSVYGVQTTTTPTVTQSVTATCTTSAAQKRWGNSPPGNPPPGNPPPGNPPPPSQPTACPTYSCSAAPSSYYPCGCSGWLQNPQQIPCIGGINSWQQCRDACIGNPKCQSFQWGSSCQHYGLSLTQQGLRSFGNGNAVLYNRGCFSSCSQVGGPRPTTTSSVSPQGWIFPTQVISSVCSCLSIPTPTTTSTVSATVTSVSATTVFTSTSIATGSTSTYTTTVATIPFVAQGTFTANNGDVYDQYPGFDLYAYNLAAGYCGTNSNPYITPLGNFTCNDYADCQDICSGYNSLAQPGDPMCLAVSFSTGIPNCYLKYGIPGNGAPQCETVIEPYNVDSAVLRPH